MKTSRRIFASLFVVLLVCSAVPQMLFAFDWIDRGIKVNSRDTTEEGTREFLENQLQQSFVVVYERNLLSDPVKENILSIHRQIMDTYNLPTISVEFKIKPALFQVNLVLADTNQQVSIINHSLDPSENLIPTVSSMVNELDAWKDLQIRNLQFIVKSDSFDAVIVPEPGSPIVNLKFPSDQPQKKSISEFAAFYNQVIDWKALSPTEIVVDYKSSRIDAVVKGEADKSVTIANEGESFLPGNINKISNSVNTIARWGQLDFKKIDFTVKGVEVYAVVLLNRAVYKGKNLMPHLPTGLRFNYNDEMAYNFRVNSGQYYVEVRDVYSSEERLLLRIDEAIQNPILYIKKYDPEFFFRQLEGIRNRNTEVYTELRDKQQSSYEELQARHERLKEAHERFLYGFITMENSGFMGTADVDKEAIARIVELKSENSDLTREELEATLKQEEFDVSDKVVDLVFNLYFNDFQ